MINESLRRDNEQKGGRELQNARSIDIPLTPPLRKLEIRSTALRMPGTYFIQDFNVMHMGQACVWDREKRREMVIDSNMICGGEG